METSDGNQNINEVQYTPEIKAMVKNLWFIYFEMKRRDKSLQNEDQNSVNEIDALESQVSLLFLTFVVFVVVNYAEPLGSFIKKTLTSYFNPPTLVFIGFAL